MTDIHSHILYNLDDGSSSLEESIELLKKLEKSGFKHVILTPHYIESSEYQATNKEKQCISRCIKKRKQINNRYDSCWATISHSRERHNI